MQIDFKVVIIALGSLGGLGLLFGAGLAFASKAFAVKTDPKYDEVLEAMPGANCGACGFPGCAAYAAAVASGEAAINLCPPGGADLVVNLSRIMGVEAPDAAGRLVATPYCNGGCEAAPTRFIYEGVKDCHAAVALSGGDKGCQYGCVGYASCVTACPFDAITMDDQEIPVVDDEKCTGCGICVTDCPKNIFSLRPLSRRVHIRCRSHDRGPVVRKLCTVGCIGCQICVKTCPFDAIHMDNLLAIIDYDKCTNCGLCIAKCPTKTIHGNLAGLPKAYIEEGCTGCTACVAVCPVNVISGEPGERHVVDEEKCVSCEACVKVCPEQVIIMR